MAAICHINYLSPKSFKKNLFVFIDLSLDVDFHLLNLVDSLHTVVSVQVGNHFPAQRHNDRTRCYCDDN